MSVNWVRSCFCLLCPSSLHSCLSWLSPLALSISNLGGCAAVLFVSVCSSAASSLLRSPSSWDARPHAAQACGGGRLCARGVHHRATGSATCGTSMCGRSCGCTSSSPSSHRLGHMRHRHVKEGQLGFPGSFSSHRLGHVRQRHVEVLCAHIELMIEPLARPLAALAGGGVKVGMLFVFSSWCGFLVLRLLVMVVALKELNGWCCELSLGWS